MPTATYAGITVALDADGCLRNPLAWTPDMALEIALQHGIGPLTTRHWQVIEFCRRHAAERGTPPGVRGIVRGTGIPRAELYRLFPGDPAVQAARVSGLPRPKHPD